MEPASRRELLKAIPTPATTKNTAKNSANQQAPRASRRTKAGRRPPGAASFRAASSGRRQTTTNTCKKSAHYTISVVASGDAVLKPRRPSRGADGNRPDAKGSGDCNAGPELRKLLAAIVAAEDGAAGSIIFTCGRTPSAATMAFPRNDRHHGSFPTRAQPTRSNQLTERQLPVELRQRLPPLRRLSDRLRRRVPLQLLAHSIVCHGRRRLRVEAISAGGAGTKCKLPARPSWPWLANRSTPTPICC